MCVYPEASRGKNQRYAAPYQQNMPKNWWAACQSDVK